MRGVDLVRPFHGVRANWVEAPAALEIVRAYAPLLGEDRFFSHSTTALLWDVPLPRSVAGVDPVHVSSVGRAPRAAGVIGHSAVRGRASLTRRHGLPVTDAATTWLTGHGS